MIRALVTGASGGIGAAICRALAGRGVQLVLQYQSDGAGAARLAAELGTAVDACVQADLGAAAAIPDFWAAARRCGFIDVLVNNAGIFPPHPPLATAWGEWLAAWDRTLAVNLSAAAHLSWHAARDMAAAGGGRIVSVSSRGAFRGEPEMPGYGASKAGLNACTQSLAKAAAPRAVLAFLVAPGWVDTSPVAGWTRAPAVIADQPLGRVATPEEVAAVVAFCALDAPPSLTGAILDVNGASYLRS